MKRKGEKLDLCLFNFLCDICVSLIDDNFLLASWSSENKLPLHSPLVMLLKLYLLLISFGGYCLHVSQFLNWSISSTKKFLSSNLIFCCA